MWIDVLRDSRGGALQSLWKGTSGCLWMESPAGISFSSLRALIAPQQHLAMLGGRANECQGGTGVRYKKAACISWLVVFGQFGFFLLHFTTVSLNPGSVFRTLLKSYFYNSASSWSQRQLLLLSLSFSLVLSLSFPIPCFALGGLLGKPFFLNHPSSSHQAHTREKLPSTALRCISTSLCLKCF